MLYEKYWHRQWSLYTRHDEKKHQDKNYVDNIDTYSVLYYVDSCGVQLEILLNKCSVVYCGRHLEGTEWVWNHTRNWHSISMNTWFVGWTQTSVFIWCPFQANSDNSIQETPGTDKLMSQHVQDQEFQIYETKPNVNCLIITLYSILEDGLK